MPEKTPLNDSNDSYDGSDEPVSRALFVYGRSGVGKTALITACAQDYNFRVIEVHAGQERKGQILKETLTEATQSERLKNKTTKSDIQNFFKLKKPEKRKVSEDTSEMDSLILFSGVDLLFSQLDEGFWAALKNFTKITKIPIVFTGVTIDANKGLNPEKEATDFNKSFISDMQEVVKCTEIHLARTHQEDLVSMIRMIALNQGILRKIK